MPALRQKDNGSGDEVPRPEQGVPGGRRKSGDQEAGLVQSVHFYGGGPPGTGTTISAAPPVESECQCRKAQRQRQSAGCYDRVQIDRETYARLFFEWAHPAVTTFCDERGLAYPPLNEEGEIEEPATWYASVRAGTAPRKAECA